MAQLIPATEPFFYPGNEVGVLLVHGFTGTPKEMHPMGEYLNRQGFSTLGPRLGGHATRPEDMIRANYSDWLASLEDGYHLLSGVAKRIYLVGLSMGGVLVLTSAPRLPVRGVVCISTPAYLPADWRLNIIDLMAKIQAYVPKSKAEPGSGWFDKQAWKNHISYPQNPVRSVGQLKRLLDEMHAALPKVNVPVLLIHSRNDDYVVEGSMPWIYERLGAPQKQMLWVEGSGHVATEDAQRETVFEAAATFIGQIEST